VGLRAVEIKATVTSGGWKTQLTKSINLSKNPSTMHCFHSGGLRQMFLHTHTQ